MGEQTATDPASFQKAVETGRHSLIAFDLAGGPGADGSPAAEGLDRVLLYNRWDQTPKME